jgi:hypothetical protein
MYQSGQPVFADNPELRTAAETVVDLTDDVSSTQEPAPLDLGPAPSREMRTQPVTYTPGRLGGIR